MTYQDIIDRRETLNLEHGEAYKAEQARIRKEYESLQELCGALGHFFAKSDAFVFNKGGRQCVFCRKSEG